MSERQVYCEQVVRATARESLSSLTNCIMEMIDCLLSRDGSMLHTLQI